MKSEPFPSARDLLRLVLNICERDYLLIGFIIVSALTYTTFSFLGVETLLEKFLVDDAYYYYSIAQNYTLGEGIVFNSGIPTNGFHPLYLLVLLPIFALTYDLGINAPIHLSLIVLSAFSIMSGILIYKILRQLGSKSAARLGAGLWLLNPYVIFVTLMGLEPPLQIFLLTLLIWYLLQNDHSVEFSRRQSVIIGILTALVFLARMDMVFVVIGIFISLSIRRFRDSSNGIVGAIESINDVILSGLVSVFIVLPFLLWNVFVVGHLFPISGTITRLRYGGSIIGMLGSVSGFGKNFFTLVLKFPRQRYDFLFLIVILVFITLLALYRNIDARKLVSKFYFLIPGIFLYYLFYSFQPMRLWYALFTVFLLTLLVGFAVGHIVDSLESSQIGKFATATIAVLLVVSFIVGGVVTYENDPNAPQEQAKWEAADFIESHDLSCTNIGSFNTGVFQYYTPNYDIYNLDGVVNTEAFEAKKSDRISEYMESNNIDCIVDSRGTLENHIDNPTFETQEWILIGDHQGYEYYLIRIGY